MVRVSDGALLYYQEIGLNNQGLLLLSIGIVIGALLMILIAVSYGALVEKFPVSGGAFALVFKFWKICAFSSWF